MDPHIHLIDETWIAASPAALAAVVAEPGNWVRWWPDLELTVSRDRGIKGIEWTARTVARGSGLAGSVEIWLEPFAEGVILHHFLRLTVVSGRPLSRRRFAARQRDYAWRAKRVFWPVKDELERAGRAPDAGRSSPERSRR